MANPFLAMSEDFSSAQENPALNPFLCGDFGATEEYTENPFAASNPFSDFGAADYGAAVTTASVNIFGLSDPVATTAANIFSTANDDICDVSSSEPLFSVAPTSHANIINSENIFGGDIHEQPPVVINTQPIIQKPTELDLSTANDENAHAYLSDDDVTKPKRPPPPARPIAPETKDLILTVTGHMELTSSHLLDRIPPTRTPSPVSMRDLHSPSPTPEPTFGDFLTEGEQKKESTSNGEGDVNLFDVDDVVTQYSCSPQQNSSPPAEVDLLSSQVTNKPEINETSPKTETAISDPVQKPARPGPPMRPTPPVRPARPSPPQKPPPPSAPQRPPPVVPPAPQTAQATDEFSLFDAPVMQSQSKHTTTKDILSLYSVPKKQETTKPIDFLTDDISDDPTAETKAPDNTVSPKEVSRPNQTPEKPAVEEVNTTETIPPEKSEPENIDVQNGNVTMDSVASNPIESEPVLTTNGNSSFADTAIINKQDEFGSQPTFVPDEISPRAEFAHSNIPEPATESNPFSAQEALNQNVFSEPIVNAYVQPTNMFETNVSHNIQITNSFVEGSSANMYAEQSYTNKSSPFGEEAIPTITNSAPPVPDAFDAFSAKFDSTINKSGGAFDAFGGSAAAVTDDGNFHIQAWGSASTGFAAGGDDGFGADDNFDAFLTLNEPPPVPSGTPAPFGKGDSQDSEDGGFNVFIKPKEGDMSSESAMGGGPVPALAPPPKSPAQAFTDTSPRFNPFDKSANYAEAAFGAEPEVSMQEGEPKMQRTDSQESPPTPLFDDDVSQPLEDFPRINYEGPGWEVQLRQPNKKKITGQRFWKKIFIKLTYQGDNPVVQLYNSATDKEPFQELPLQACYSVSDIAAQQYDQYGKIFTVKLQYVFYKERPGVRPGQVTKAERITNKLSQFAAYAIQGDYQGVKEFGSDLKKLGLPVEHAPQVSQLFKIGSTNYEDMKQFSMCVEESLFRLNAHRDRALHYKMEEVQITAVDELYVEQDAEGRIIKQIARVRLFFIGFLSGMPDVELGVNDMHRQGKEVVGRHDIIPVATEEWIRLEGVEFHSCVQPEDYNKTRIIKFKPPDACYIELMRFRVRPPKNRELPLQLKAVLCVTGNRVELRADVLVPGFTSRSLGQVPCEDVMIRFPIPECWIYLFRVEKHFRYGSVKSAHRRTGKIKGIERILGAVDNLQESLIEVTSGQAKYEHQHRSIVWRMPRLPKEGQGAYTTHNLVCRMALTSYDQIPEKLAEWCYVEFTMPATQVSHTTVRSVSFQSHDSDEPPEKYVRYLARHEYKVGIEHAQGEGPGAYVSATMAKQPIKEEPKEPEPAAPPAPSSDSDSD